MEVSIHELLAAAREAVKSDYIKGESILCEIMVKRYTLEIIQQVKEVDKAISGTVKTGQFTIVDYSQHRTINY